MYYVNVSRPNGETLYTEPKEPKMSTTPQLPEVVRRFAYPDSIPAWVAVQIDPYTFHGEPMYQISYHIGLRTRAYLTLVPRATTDIDEMLVWCTVGERRYREFAKWRNALRNTIGVRFDLSGLTAEDFNIERFSDEPIQIATTHPSTRARATKEN